MKIWEYVPTDGPGVGVYWVMSKIPDHTATASDVQEALRWAERDGKVTRLGAYYWRNHANSR